MNKEISYKEDKWYWINIKGYGGKPFGKIITIINHKVIVAEFWVFDEVKHGEIINESMVINSKYIGKKFTAEDRVNILPTVI